MFEIRIDGDTVYLSGRLDATSVDRARDTLNLVESDARVDFDGLGYISSAGLGVLLGTQKRLSASGHSLTLTNLNPHIREIFRIAGFDKVFAIE